MPSKLLPLAHSTPPVPTLTRVVIPVARSRRKQSPPPFVSPATRLLA